MNEWMNIELRMDTISVTGDVNSDLVQELESVKRQLMILLCQWMMLNSLIGETLFALKV